MQNHARPGLTGVLGALTVTGGLVVMDQLSKIAAGQVLDFPPPRNHEYAFGIAGGSPEMLVIVAIAVLTVFLATVAPLMMRYGVSPGLPALIAGGTLSNTLDRARLGAVRDFIATPWAIINVADLCVAAGIVGLGIALTMRALSPRRVTS